MGPMHPRLEDSGMAPAIGNRPCVGFRPTVPQKEDGTLIKPAVSVPSVNGTLRVATAAAEPPLDPPVSRSDAHGLRVGPHAEM
jgi:hypothetical protein